MTESEAAEADRKLGARGRRDAGCEFRCMVALENPVPSYVEVQFYTHRFRQTPIHKE